MPQYVDILRSAFIDLWAGIVLFVPKLVFALIVFLLGLILASILNKVVIRIVEALHIDELIKKLELDVLFHRAGLKLDIGKA